MSNRTIDDADIRFHPTGLVYHGARNPKGNQLRLPMRVRRVARFQDRLVLVLHPEKKAKKSDFTVEKTRNVVAIDPDCTLLWTVDSGPTPGGDVSHERIFPLDDRLVTRGETDTFAEIDLDTGTVENRWNSDEFVVADAVHQFRRDVTKVETLDDITLIQIRTDNGGELYGFDADGRRLWHRIDDHHWKISTRESAFRVYTPIRRGTTIAFNLDPETGKIVEAVEGPDEFVQPVLDGEEEGQT